MCLQAVGVSFEMTACLLHNEPASYSYVARLSSKYGAVGKPSLNRAIKLDAVDAKPCDLTMARLKLQ